MLTGIQNILTVFHTKSSHSNSVHNLIAYNNCKIFSFTGIADQFRLLI
jgi:hypothetical protein